jgi:hypothetical protein
MPSTVIASFHYSTEKKILTVIFTTGKVYDYLKVPEDVYSQMKNSFSKGIYFNEYIKGKYKYRKVGE